MYLFRNYDVLFSGSEDSIANAADWFHEELGTKIGDDGNLHVEEDNKHMCVEDLKNWLGKLIVRHSETEIMVNGWCDHTTADGELEDFSIQIKDRNMTIYRSGYYYEAAKDSYEDYFDFCSQIENRGGSPIYTKEEFEDAGEFLFIFENEANGEFELRDEPKLDKYGIYVF